MGETDDSDSIPVSYTVMFNSSERGAAAAATPASVGEFLEDKFADLNLELDIGEMKAEGEFVVGSSTGQFLDPHRVWIENCADADDEMTEYCTCLHDHFYTSYDHRYYTADYLYTYNFHLPKHGSFRWQNLAQAEQHWCR